MLCGRVRKRGEDAEARCAGCGERAPRGQWEPRDKTPWGQRALRAVQLVAIGVFLGAVALKILMAAAGAGRFSALQIIAVLASLALVVIGGFVVFAAWETLFVWSATFESPGRRIEGEAHMSGNRIEWVSVRRYSLRLLDVARAPGASRLSSASARAAGPRALLGCVVAFDRHRAWGFLDDDTVVCVAAILGMAARGELDVLVGEAQGFRISSKFPGELRSDLKIWLRPRSDGGPLLPFEGRLVEHARTLSASLPRERVPRAVPGGYRGSATPEEPLAPAVALCDVLGHFYLQPRQREEHLLQYLRRPPAEEGASLEDIAAAFLDAAKIELEATRQLALGVHSVLELGGC
jgi:hypothetical protein